jgi:L-threonylcarbamoyladenylate synthase
MHLYCGKDDAVREALAESLAHRLGEGERVGLLIAVEDVAHLRTDGPGVEVGVVGSLHDMEEVARNLFRVMRELDATHPELILARDVPETGLGRAIRDRLRRAAKVVVEL